MLIGYGAPFKKAPPPDKPGRGADHLSLEILDSEMKAADQAVTAWTLTMLSASVDSFLSV